MGTPDFSFDYDQYSASMAGIDQSIRKNLPQAVEHLKKCDHLILSNLVDLGSVEALSAATHAHSLYLAACKLALGGHFSAMFPLMRTALEAAIYGYLFNKEEGLVEKWRNRHESEEGFKRSKEAFTRAINRFRGYVQEHDRTSGDTPYEKHIFGLYDASIDYGGHPNPIALTNATSVVEETGFLKFRYDYLRKDKHGVVQGMLACFDYGIILAVITHLSRMEVTKGLPGLDATFQPFFRETNVLADDLHGQPIGFDTRYYERINDFVKQPEA